MKGITNGEWVIDERFTNEHGVDVVSIGMWNDKRDIINAIHVFESEDGGTAENEAELICTAGNLTNAGYNIEAMPQLVEALEDMKVFFHSWLQQDSETLGYKAAIKALESLKSAKL